MFEQMTHNTVCLVLLFVLTVNLTAGREDKYCKLNCGTELHTMCKYRPGPAEACGSQFNSSLSEAEKQDILRVHNEYRMKVASGKEEVNGIRLPKAADMMELEWDEELEQIAQRLTEQCLFVAQHDACRNSERFEVEQNIGRSSRSIAHSETLSLITHWYNEVKLFHPDNVIYNGDLRTSHFTQVTWAKSRFVGCARVIWNNQQQLTCNYGPAGNILESPVYMTGVPCSECPDDSFCSPRYNSLCTYKKEENFTDERNSATRVLLLIRVSWLLCFILCCIKLISIFK